MTNSNEKEPAFASTSKVSQAAGVKWPILPGESPEKYYNGLQSTINELGAKTELQIYLAEKIFQCLWWIRRYESQKRSLIINSMAKGLTEYSTPAKQKGAIRTLLNANSWDDPSLQAWFTNKGLTQESLLQGAISDCQLDLLKLDQQIALRIKTLSQLQQSYEALVNRAIIQERIKLQNEFLKRDLQSIDIAEVKQVDQTSNDKPKTKKSK